MLRIYISSNYSELKECRENIRDHLEQIGCEDISAEYLLEKESITLEKRLNALESCDFYVGIFTFLYGDIIENGKSINELEFRKAIKENKRCIIFLLNINANWLPCFVDKGEKGEKNKRLRVEISKVNRTNIKVVYFKSTEELTLKLSGYLSGYLLSRNQKFLEKYSQFILHKYRITEKDNFGFSYDNVNLNAEINPMFVESKAMIVSEMVIDSIDNSKNKENEYLFIIGDSDIGKFIISLYIFLFISNFAQYKKICANYNVCLPFLIEIRIFFDLYSKYDKITFVDYLQNSLTKIGCHLKDGEIDKFLKINGNSLFIFNGLDEIDIFEHKKMSDMILEFKKKYPKVQIILTSRTSDFTHQVFESAGFRCLDIQKFDSDKINFDEIEKQIRQNIDKQFSLCQLLKNPVFLTIFILSCQGIEIPKKMYESSVKSFIKQIDKCENAEEILIYDLFGKFWEYQAWHGILATICGMKEKLVPNIIEYLLQVYDPQWFGEHLPWNVVLAIRCFSSLKTTDQVEEIAEKILTRILKLFEMVKWTQDINTFLEKDVLCAVKLVDNWPKRELIKDWIFKIGPYSTIDTLDEFNLYFTNNLLIHTNSSYGYFEQSSEEFFLEETDLHLTNAWAEFVRIVGSDSKEIYEHVKKGLDDDDYSKLLSLIILGKDRLSLKI